MADEIPTNRPVVATTSVPVVTAGAGPGSDLVSIGGILGLTTYLAAMIGICLYGLIVFWPTPTPSGQQPAQESKTNQQINSTTSASPSPAPGPAASATP